MESTVLKMYYDEYKPAYVIAKHFGCSATKINKIIKLSPMPVDMHMRSLMYSKNRMKNADYFDSIDCEEKAYWLGFIYADGNVDKIKRSMFISLSALDQEHLQKLGDIFEKNVFQIESTKDGKKLSGAMLKVNNTYLCDRLIKLGIYPQKTSLDIADVFDYIPTHLMKHFIRGFFDGDGCTSGVGVSFVGGFNFLSRLRKEMSFMNTPGSFYQEGNVWRLKWHGIKLFQQFSEWLYEDATVYLERKHKKIKTLEEAKQAAIDFADSVS